jgi:hypothetical protein
MTTEMEILMRRFAAAGVVRSMTVALAMVLTAPSADAQAMDDLAITEAAAAMPPGRFLWADDPAALGRVSVLISLPDQRAYVFRGNKMIAASAVSTGSDEKPTPLGRFTILEKKAMHRSNLYDDAPMPFMQRLTWDGVALHAGRNPGFPASHGCVRLPAAFAKKLFAATALGATVEVTDEAYVAGAMMEPGGGRELARR